MIDGSGNSKWHSCEDHDFKTCDLAANCYSFVLNKPEYYWSVPGLGYIKSPAKEFFDEFNNYFSRFSVEQFRNALIKGAQRDGLVIVNEPKSLSGYYLSALFFSNDNSDYDFHWYKQERNGLWVHKNGWHEPSNLDDEGNPIRDPFLEVSKEYPVFGGYFQIPERGVELIYGFPIESK